MKFIMDYIRKETWSPYIAGALLGIVGVLAVLLSNSLLGASGAFENIAGLIGKAVAPTVFDNMYFNFIMPPGITWGVVLAALAVFGPGQWSVDHWLARRWPRPKEPRCRD